jgi:hypothetical protein
VFCFARVRLQTHEQIRIPQGRPPIAMQVTSRGLPQALGIKAAWIIFLFPLLHRVTGNNSLSTIRDDAHRVAGDCQYLRIWEPTNETCRVPSVTEAAQVTSFESIRGMVDLGLRLRLLQVATHRRVVG